MAARDSGNTTASPAPTVTRTVTEPAAVEGDSEPRDEPAEEPAQELEPTEAPATWNPKPNDFEVGIKVLKRTCYETLPCDIDFRIVPKYVGSQRLPSKGVTEVTYEVLGGEQDIRNTFRVDSEGAVTYQEEEFAEVRKSRKLTAKVTDVTYDEFG